jgi:protein-S-isoprenylcysteine O-methyltransferase Ste14
MARIRAEENFLRAHFREPYRRHRARTSRLIPGVH